MPDWIRVAFAISSITLVFSIGLLIGILGSTPSVVYPSIIPIQLGHAGSITPMPAYAFAFRDGMETIHVRLNASVYFGAKYADKNATFYRDVPEDEWLKEYYRVFIDNPCHEELFWQLLEQFRKIRTERSLDDDEYLELMTVFVQSIPYKTDNAGSPPKFPVETIADRNGDCDDKSLLLSGLLAYEGYNVSLLYFSPEEHMAVGVAGSGSTYRDTGYLYIETTNPSYVGISPKNLTGGVPLRSYPLVIRIGNGTRSFERNNETQYISDALASADERIISLRPDILSYKQKIDDTSQNKRLNEYTALVEEYNALIREHNENVRVYEYILQHQHDREGTYRWLKEHG
jgi:hypothetical protein